MMFFYCAKYKILYTLNGLSSLQIITFENKLNIMIQEASAVGVVKVILIIIVLYYVIKVFKRIFLPILAKKAMEKLQEKMREQAGHPRQQRHYQEHKKSKVGETTIDKKPNKKDKKLNDDFGEYVDYEDVKD
ncbi:DUF4834 family protein [Aureivirga marina]|uniref:DUF4834 family protein n=1 Tax=Aureivirga marina TaxID=1182451 RepID=UPI0018CBA1B6|nr:DUF4834 family protein [Aureivirga marina]